MFEPIERHNRSVPFTWGDSAFVYIDDNMAAHPSAVGKQKRCLQCKVSLPKSRTDPHPICVGCRGQECNVNGPKCQFCSEWPIKTWNSVGLAAKTKEAGTESVAKLRQGRSLKGNSKRLSKGKDRPRLKSKVNIRKDVNDFEELFVSEDDEVGLEFSGFSPSSQRNPSLNLLPLRPSVPSNANENGEVIEQCRNEAVNRLPRPNLQLRGEQPGLEIRSAGRPRPSTDEDRRIPVSNLESDRESRPRSNNISSDKENV